MRTWLRAASTASGGLPGSPSAVATRAASHAESSQNVRTPSARAPERSKAPMIAAARITVTAGPAAATPETTRRARDDTTLLVSISGFTMLTERLARADKIQPPV